MKLLRSFAPIAVLLAGVAITSCKSSNPPISGAGSTFVYPLMTRWIAAYSQTHPDTRINYQSIGSGGGIQQVRAGTVDFGATDAALTDEQLAAMKPVIQIPETAGPVCITYNLSGLAQPLRLSPEALAGIFLGKITTWHDHVLQMDNPGVALPDEKIVVIHRAEGSGTTNIFTSYLAAVSPVWESEVGKGTSVSWPLGLGGKGSEGVTGQIRQSPGAIGYVELTYAEQNHLPVASIRNLNGQYVAPSTGSTTATIAAFAKQLAEDPRTPIVNPPGNAPDAYPIAGLTFLIIPRDGPNKQKRLALRGFIQYIIGDGQQLAGTLAYAPLPDGVKEYDLNQLGKLTADSKPLD